MKKYALTVPVNTFSLILHPFGDSQLQDSSYTPDKMDPLFAARIAYTTLYYKRAAREEMT